MNYPADPKSGVRLSTLLPEARLSGIDEIIFSSCCSDWEQCQPGDLFIAIESADSDGHQYIADAIANGAVGVVTERLVACPKPICIVEDTREAYARICQGLLGNPSQKMHTIAVAGTSGKTITAHLLQSILNCAGIPTGVISSNSCTSNSIKPKSKQTDYTPPEIATALAEMQSEGIQAVVIEASSKALAQRQLQGLTFDSVVTTNLKPNHLKYHGSESNYLRAKRRIFNQIADHGLAIFDGDDQVSQKWIEQWSLPALTISMEDRGEFNAYLIERHLGEQSFLISAGDESVAVETKSVGDAHIRCAMLAAATAISMGVDLITVARGIERVTKIPGRMEAVTCGQPFGVFVDRARTPNELSQTLKGLREVTAGRLICVFGAKQELTSEERANLGRAAERYANLAMITSDDPGNEAPLSIAHDILDGYHKTSRDHVIPDRREAIRFALSQAQAGDTVVIAGKGDQQTQEIAGNSWRFDDREECVAFLESFQEPGFEDTMDSSSSKLKSEHLGPADSIEIEPIIFPIENYRRNAR